MGRALVTVTAVCASAAAGSAAAGAPELMIGVRPTSVVAFDGTVTIFGSVAGAASRQRVTFEGKECGTPGSFHLVGGTTTAGAGAFSGTLALAPGVRTSYRARWRDLVSNVVVVRVAPHLELRRAGRRFTVTVSGHGYLRGKRVTLERRTSGGWVRVRTMTIRDAFGNGGLASGVARVASGLVFRAVFPRSQAAPCFVPALSNTVRT